MAPSRTVSILPSAGPPVTGPGPGPDQPGRPHLDRSLCGRAGHRTPVPGPRPPVVAPDGPLLFRSRSSQGRPSQQRFSRRSADESWQFTTRIVPLVWQREAGGRWNLEWTREFGRRFIMVADERCPCSAVLITTGEGHGGSPRSTGPTAHLSEFPHHPSGARPEARRTAGGRPSWLVIEAPVPPRPASSCHDTRRSPVTVPSPVVGTGPGGPGFAVRSGSINGPPLASQNPKRLYDAVPVAVGRVGERSRLVTRISIRKYRWNDYRHTECTCNMVNGPIWPS